MSAFGMNNRPRSTHTRRMRFSGPLTGVLCKRPFPEFVAKIRIQRQRSSADIYRSCEQNCNRPAAFKNATVRERPVAVLPLARKPPLIIARTDITGRGVSVARLRLRDLDMSLLESPVRSGVESHDGHRTPSVFRLKALAKHLADGLADPCLNGFGVEPSVSVRAEAIDASVADVGHESLGFRPTAGAEVQKD